jgi:hypothetical protein
MGDSSVTVVHIVRKAAARTSGSAPLDLRTPSGDQLPF